MEASKSNFRHLNASTKHKGALAITFHADAFNSPLINKLSSAGVKGKSRTIKPTHYKDARRVFSADLASS